MTCWTELTLPAATWDTGCAVMKPAGPEATRIVGPSCPGATLKSSPDRRSGGEVPRVSPAVDKCHIKPTKAGSCQRFDPKTSPRAIRQAGRRVPTGGRTSCCRPCLIQLRRASSARLSPRFSRFRRPGPWGGAGNGKGPYRSQGTGLRGAERYQGWPASYAAATSPKGVIVLE